MSIDRRAFLRKAAATVAGSALSYNRISRRQ